MELIARPPRTYHVSHDTVMEVEDAILRDPRVRPATMNVGFKAAATVAAKLLQRAGLNAGSVFGAHRRASLAPEPTRDYLAVMMGLDVAGCAPWFVLKARKSVYLFDAWPRNHGDIRSFVESWGVQYAFVSSSEAAERLAAISDRCTFIWVPEGVDPARYQWRSHIEKDIDVLQLGRKYDAHHAVITPALEKAGKSYLYERTKGTIVFPSRDQFIDGLARTRISICVPSSLTHPERAGDIETMTVRYLQSMASKCLVLGRTPGEMVELFGYDPVVEIDMRDPAGQILHILENFEDYIPLIERNFERVVNDHTWTGRWERIAAVLFPDIMPFQTGAGCRRPGAPE
jgi:hypothetical protein